MYGIKGLLVYVNVDRKITLIIYMNRIDSNLINQNSKLKQLGKWGWMNNPYHIVRFIILIIFNTIVITINQFK